MTETAHFDPKYVTFDCYGTLTWFQMSRITKEVLGDRLPAESADAFLRSFEAYRFDEVLGAWKPYRDVIAEAYRRATTRHGIEYTDADADRIYADIPTWGPLPDVPEGLAVLARRYPLVILSNASNDQIDHNVRQLGAPFHAVYTAQQAQAYKPRLGAFEYMLDQLGVGPDEIVHVSTSLRYDIMPASDLGITNKVLVNRGHEPSPDFPGYGYTEIRKITELPALFGLSLAEARV